MVAESRVPYAAISEDFMILTSVVLTRAAECDGQMDGRTPLPYYLRHGICIASSYEYAL